LCFGQIITIDIDECHYIGKPRFQCRGSGVHVRIAAISEQDYRA